MCTCALSQPPRRIVEEDPRFGHLEYLVCITRRSNMAGSIVGHWGQMQVAFVLPLGWRSQCTETVGSCPSKPDVISLRVVRFIEPPQVGINLTLRATW
jgi:hypothetical protein